MIRALFGPAIGVLVTVVAFVLLFVGQPWQGIGEALLRPGTFLPQSYWGGFHDVGPILLALLLNVMFYAVVAHGLRIGWTKIQGKGGDQVS
jgi:hypothetical protein